MDVCQEGPEMALMAEAAEEEARTHIICLHICIHACRYIHAYKFIFMGI